MAFDSSITSFTTMTNKVDLVDAAHINAVRTEITTIETILGTGIKGTAASLAARLNNALDSDGTILSGTAFPSPAVSISQPFFRTDLDTLYIKGSTGWLAQGGTLSNVIFVYSGLITETSTYGESTQATTIAYASTVATNRFLVSKTKNIGSGAGSNVITTTILKVTGVSTLTLYGELWSATAIPSDEQAKLRLTVNGLYTEITSTSESTTPTWYSSTLDITSLTNGTAYTITFSLGQVADRNSTACCANIVVFGS